MDLDDNNESSFDNSWHICCADDFELEKINCPVENEQPLMENGPNKEADISKVKEVNLHNLALDQDGPKTKAQMMLDETTCTCNLEDEKYRLEQHNKNELAAIREYFVQEENKRKKLDEEMRMWKDEAEQRIKQLEGQQKIISSKIDYQILITLLELYIGYLLILLLVDGALLVFSISASAGNMTIVNDEAFGVQNAQDVADPNGGQTAAPNVTEDDGSNDVWSLLEEGMVQNLRWKEWRLIHDNESWWYDTIVLDPGSLHIINVSADSFLDF